MNKFTIEADGERVDVELVQPCHETLTALMIGRMDLCYGKRAGRIYNILHKAYAETPNLSEAYEQLREAPEKMTAQRETLRTVKDELRDLLRSRMDAPPQPARKIVQVSGYDSGDTALCDDGTVWVRPNGGNKWKQLPPIPQEDTTNPEGEV